VAIPAPLTIRPKTFGSRQEIADNGELRYPLYRTEYYGAEVQFCVYRILTNAEIEERGFHADASPEAQGEYFTTLPAQAAERDDATEISLYLPAGLSFNDGVSYDNVNIGVLGLLSEAPLTDGGDGSGGAAKDISGALEKSSGKFKTAVVKLLSSNGGEAGAISGALRIKENPQTRVLFGSVPVRTFEFSFQFLPNSLLEAETIIKIIKTFRTELYPEGIARVGGTYLGYNYPDVFRIKFLYDGKEIEDAPKLLDCYLQGVQTNYNPSQMAFFKDGKFSEITMSLSFTETRTLFRQDIVNGGY
jgi:hypothetical protein